MTFSLIGQGDIDLGNSDIRPKKVVTWDMAFLESDRGQVEL